MSNEPSTESMIRQSKTLLKLQKYSEVHELLQKVLESNPNEEDALELLGMTCFFQKKLPSARDFFERLTQINPSHSAAWVNLGAIFNRMGDFKKATEVLRRALQRDRKCAEAYYNMAIAHRGLQMNTMAISAYKEALKLSPEMVDANINLGNLYMEMKNVGLAIQCFTAALKHRPDSEKAKRCLEKAQSQQKQARKETSPFGRLVDMSDLESQQSLRPVRSLDQVARKDEREEIQKQTKLLRAATKEYIGQLEQNFPQQLHKIKIAILHVDEHIDATEPMHALLDGIENTKEQHQLLKRVCHQLKSDLERQ